MRYTAYDIILDYMKMTENHSQTGFGVLETVLKHQWYSVFKNTKESVVRKWVPVEKGVVKYPNTLDNLLGLYIVDSCGNLAPLYEDTSISILELPESSCGCKSCNGCLCGAVKDNFIQTAVMLGRTLYTNKVSTRLLKNGNLMEESSIWVPSFDKNGIFVKAVNIKKESVKTKVETAPCGCPIESDENSQKLFNAGCIIDCYVPSLKERYPKLYNEFGYYKEYPEKREVHIFDTVGKKARLKMIELVYESNGSDMEVPEYAVNALLAALDYGKKMYSPNFDEGQKIAARKRFKGEMFNLAKEVNPLSYEMFVQVNDPRMINRNRYRGIHSDFIQQDNYCCMPEIPQVTVVQPQTIYVNSTSFFSGMVGGGSIDDPIAGNTTFQSGKLIGLGINSKNRIFIIIDGVRMLNWGNTKGFDFNATNGAITLLNGYQWIDQSSLEIDLTQ